MGDTQEHDQEKSSVRHIPWRHKISRTKFRFGVLTALLVLATVGFLAFLWSYTRGGNVNWVFYRLVVDDWIVRAVTITTVLLRFAVSTSASIATSMLAALALELRGTDIRSAASISILRFVNSGPRSLLRCLKPNWKYNWRATATTSILFLITLLLQFASTILASDLGRGVVIGPENKNATNTRITQASLDRAGTSPSVSGTPREFPAFSELHSEGATDSESIHDTGILLRGLLPFTSSATRTSIQAYSGQSTVLDSRVVCVRPQVSEEMTLIYVEGDSWYLNGTWLPEGNVEGLLAADYIPKNPANNFELNLDFSYNNGTFARYSNQIFNTNQDGSVEAAFAERLSEDIFAMTFFESTVSVPSAQGWTLSFLPLASGPVLLSSLDPRYPFTASGDLLEPAPSGYPSGPRLPRYRQSDPVALLTGSAYLVVNITQGDLTKLPPFNSSASANGSVNNPAYLFATYEEGVTNLVLTPNGEWLTYSLPWISGFQASISLCYDSFVAMDLQLNMTTNHTISEPSLIAYNATTNSFGTALVQTQLDYARSESESMILKTSVDDMRSQADQSYQSALEQNITNMDLESWMAPPLQKAFALNNFYVMCSGCTNSNRPPNYGPRDVAIFGSYNTDGFNVYVTGATQQIFIDVLQATSDISLALSDYTTILARALYYDTLPYYDLTNEATIQQFASGLFPRRFTGLTIVLAALLVHICIVSTVTIVFMTRTRVSIIGGAAWQAVAQVQAQDLQDLLPEALMTSDKEFRKRMVNEGLGGNIARFDSAMCEVKKNA